MNQNFQMLGVVHLLPLPGTPNGRFSLNEVLARACQDAEVILHAGFQGFVLENFGDAPFVRETVPPHIVSSMTMIACHLRERFGESYTLGINVLRNDAQSALAIALAAKAHFVRVNVHIGAAWTDQGLIQGGAYQTLMYRKSIDAEAIQIASDVLVKHAVPAGISNLELLAKDTALRGNADIVIVTGAQTGLACVPEDITRVQAVIPNTPVWVGSGVTPQNIAEYMHASGAIIGTYLHKNGDIGQPLSRERAKEFFA